MPDLSVKWSMPVEPEAVERLVGISAITPEERDTLADRMPAAVRPAYRSVAEWRTTPAGLDPVVEPLPSEVR